MELRPHQAEAVDNVVRILGTPPGGHMPPEGLRTQVIAATGSGKSLIGAESARRLSARRVLVVVPTLDLLTQMAGAWRRAGRSGAMIGVCSLRAEESQGLPCTTDPDELVSWLEGLETVTVFATYASVGLRILQRAHAAGLGVWSLMIIDEAHRTSGDGMKPWAAVHDQAQLPAERRLYMTATPRVWEAGAGGERPRLVASMEDGSPVFGPVAYRLTLSEGVARGIVAPYQVLCLDIRDPELYAAMTSEDSGSDAVRGARLAAVQAGLMRAAVTERFRRVLSFHSRVGEAEAMAAAVPVTAGRLAEDDPDMYPPADRVWADWLYGEHAPAHRRQVLDEFASDFLGGPGYDGRDVRAELRVLSSVRVLGEGVDTAECDAVLFADARGSMVDIVQMVGRALRLHPGQGKLATLIVPVFLGPDEDPNELLTSNAYDVLSKILGALRAHDADTIEALADPRLRNSRRPSDDHGGEDGVGVLDGDGQEQDLVPPVGAAAAGVLRFTEERDPAALTQFVRLRVIDPEGAYWRRGIEAATRWLRETGNTELRVPYTYETPEDWGALGGHPLGVWLADQRRYYAAGALEAKRVTELGNLGMVWSVHASAWEAGLAVARDYAAIHGHCLPGAGVVWDGYPLGVFLKNARTAAKKARENAVRRANGEEGVSYAGELSESRMEALNEIDPGWAPEWEIGWQRSYRLLLAHVKAGGQLPAGPGDVVVQGEDLAVWVAGQVAGWDRLLPAQQYLLESLGVHPENQGVPVVPVRRSQDERWAMNLAAARQFHAREGHLRPARKHVETITTDGGGQEVAVKLGAWLDNARRRVGTMSAERRAALAELGLEWAVVEGGA
ncbi:Helicase associated domain protein [Streptomyces sp. NPDC091972]|uniref:DEAD/DEAH box helicase n=1 Tax=Streptomyces sp. NPDC091972 TaxID=3366007 RepID=UPI0038264EB2